VKCVLVRDNYREKKDSEQLVGHLWEYHLHTFSKETDVMKRFIFFLFNNMFNREKKKRESGKGVCSKVHTISFKLKKKKVYNKYHVWFFSLFFRKQKNTDTWHHVIKHYSYICFFLFFRSFLFWVNKIINENKYVPVL
jgi:hypothetical protein